MIDRQALDRVLSHAEPGELLQLGAEIQGRALSVLVAPKEAPPEADESLTAEEAARRLGVSASWLYKSAKGLPFACRVGRRLTFSAKGLERWRMARMRES